MAHLESEPSRSTLRSMSHTDSSHPHRIHEDPARFSSPRFSLPSWFPTSYHLPILYFLLFLWRNVQAMASDQLLQLFILTFNFDFKELLVSKSEIRFRGCNRIAHTDHHGISSWLVWKKSSPRVWGWITRMIRTWSSLSRLLMIPKTWFSKSSLSDGLHFFNAFPLFYSLDPFWIALLFPGAQETRISTLSFR